MAEKTIPETKKEKDVVKREITRNPENYVTPMVDIYETPDALNVLADLPGIERSGLTVKVEEGILTIEGKTSLTKAQSYFSREFEPVNFFRQFELPEEIDQEKIGAELKHGVLNLTLPKLARRKPKNIEVKIS